MEEVLCSRALERERGNTEYIKILHQNSEERRPNWPHFPCFGSPGFLIGNNSTCHNGKPVNTGLTAETSIIQAGYRPLKSHVPTQYFHLGYTCLSACDWGGTNIFPRILGPLCGCTQYKSSLELVIRSDKHCLFFFSFICLNLSETVNTKSGD